MASMSSPGSQRRGAVSQCTFGFAVHVPLAVPVQGASAEAVKAESSQEPFVWNFGEACPHASIL